MTISSSLNAGVAGLNANASRLASISDNIANSNTYGFKRSVTDFQSLVAAPNQSSFSAGGVRTSTVRMIDQQGSLLTSDNPTDLAVSGRGMLPTTSVTSLRDAGGDTPLMLVTTGSFRPDEQGYLRTDSGKVLMGWPAASDGDVPVFPRDTVDGLEPIRLAENQFAGDPTTRITYAANLPATATEAGAAGDPLEMSIEYFDNLGTSENLDITFTPNVPATGASNSWTMTVRDSASADAVVAEYVLGFNDDRASGGTLQSVAAAAGNPGDPYDPATGQISFNAASGPISMRIGEIGDPEGISQLSNAFAPVTIDKNGSPVGNLVSVEMDANGYLSAIYDVGVTRTIYQVPLVDVPNPNGLTTLSDQAYQVSTESGPYFLWNAGEGPTGEIVGYAREESATDVAGELTQLIQTQRAYTSNAKVIQTVDEMLQETTNIKR